MRYEDLTDEQKAKLEECKTPEDILELAKSEGCALSDEELEAINGGRVLMKGGNPAKW